MDKEKSVQDTKSVLLEIGEKRKLRFLWLIEDGDEPS